jgi:hypothetical protein
VSGDDFQAPSQVASVSIGEDANTTATPQGLVDKSPERERVNLLYAPLEPIFSIAAPMMLEKGWSVWPQERDGRRMPSRVGGHAVRWGEYADRLPTAAEMKLFCTEAWRANVALALGFAAGRTFAVDIDCMDPEVSARVQAIAFEVLGPTPLVRIGRAPKTALIYRWSDRSPRSRSVKFRDHEECALEILGHGKPLTIHGLHHVTGRYFMWPEANPMTSAPQVAPEVSAERVEEFLVAVEAEFPFVRATSPIGPRTAYAATVRADHRGGIVMPARREGARLTDGREEYLKTLAWSAVRLNGHALLRAHQDGTLETTTQQVVAAVCQQFEEECEMSGRWNSGLAEAADARVGSAVVKLVKGEMTPAPVTVPAAPARQEERPRMWDDWLDNDEDLDGPEPQPDFVLPGLLAGSVGMLISPGGVGKSMLAMGLSACVAAGQNLWGLLPEAPKQGPVVFLSAEDPKVMLVKRKRAMAATEGGGEVLSDPEFRAAWRFKAVRGKRFSLGRWTPQHGFAPSPSFEVFQEELAVIKPRLIVLDTLNRILRGVPENDNAAMSDVISELEAVLEPLGAACVVPHHVSKGAAMSGSGDIQQAARGAGAITDNARWVWNLTGMSKEEAEQHLIADEVERRRWLRLTNSKVNYGEGEVERWLRRSAGGVLVGAHPAMGQDGLRRKAATFNSRRKKDTRHD